MALNNNARFYKKLLDYISISFCLFFFVAANVLRFHQLENSKTPFVPTVLQKPHFVYHLSYEDLATSQIKMLFLNDFNQSFLSNVFSNIDAQNFVLINCSDAPINKLKNFLLNRFENIEITEKSCNIEQPDLELLLQFEKTFVVFLNQDLRFSHPSATKAAERLKLKPQIHLSEIKNAN